MLRARSCPDCGSPLDEEGRCSNHDCRRGATTRVDLPVAARVEVAPPRESGSFQVRKCEPGVLVLMKRAARS